MTRAILPLALAAIFPLRATAQTLAPDDYGHMAFPVINVDGSTGRLDGVTLSVSGQPAWLHLDPDSSILGPISLDPGGERCQQLLRS